MAIKRIKKNSVSEEVLKEFKRLISSGEWKAGEKIPSENELAQIMGVSRVSIRSALEKLKSIGLVESRQGGGTFVCAADGSQCMNALFPVAMLGDEQQEYVLEFRRILECEQARLVALRADEEDLEDLGKNLEKMKKMKDDYPAFAEADLEFHMLLAKGCKNPLMIQTSQILREAILGNICFSGDSRDVEEALACHERLLEAILERDGEKACQIMKEHMREAEKYIKKEGKQV